MDFRIRVKKGTTEVEVQGTEEYVDLKFNELKEAYLENQESPSGTTEDNGSERTTPPLPDNLPSFLTQKGDPDTNLDRVLVFAYWLDQYGTHEFTRENLEECFTLCRLPVPTNIPRDLASLQSDGLILPRGRAGRFSQYSLSRDGVEHVESLGTT